MSEIYLHRNDITSISKFLDSFPDKEVVLVKSDTSSGIGTVMTVSVIGVVVNGHITTVTKTICDETKW